jgi:hypothetical protein
MDLLSLSGTWGFMRLRVRKTPEQATAGLCGDRLLGWFERILGE